MLLNTNYLYYARPYATKCLTRWERRGPSTIAVLDSVAFPEGGGQLPDQGVVRQGNREAVFTDTQKHFTRTVFSKDFPPVEVDGEIHLSFNEELPNWDEDLPVEVAIDAVRRAQLTRSHTAAHLIYLGIQSVLPSVELCIRSCRIDVDTGRFDVATPERFSGEQLEIIYRTAFAWSDRDLPVFIDGVPHEPGCRVWACGGMRIPCGGCHLPRTGLVGRVSVSRRAKGKGLDRIYYKLLDPLPTELLNLYNVAPDQFKDQ